MSLPSRERGLKLKEQNYSETRQKSLPSRERGLKFTEGHIFNTHSDVAPLAGAWIEISAVRLQTMIAPRRSPRGSVD